jgi:hypothetical protein
MNYKLRRTPLAAAIGVLVCLAVPAVAQAHHVESKATAKCELVGNQPTVTVEVKFLGFQDSEKQVTGTIRIDDVVVKNVVATDVNWTGADGSLLYTKATTPGMHRIKGEFDWPGRGGNNGTAYAKVTCPAPPAHPAITLDKTGADTATAGSTFTYSFTATNTGDVTLTNVVLTDDKCQSTLTRTDTSDPTFDPGDAWTYTCTVTAPAGPAQVDNRAEVCGDYQPPQGDEQTVCDDDTHTFTVPPPSTPPTTPPTTPPATPPATTPPSSTPGTTPPGGSGVLPETVVSGRAALRGPSGCVKQAFRARVRGRSIAAVTFFVDGRRVKRIAGSRSVYRLKVRPSRYGFGRHQIVARVEFTAASGTDTRRLRLTFRRCAQGTVAPRFTG